MATINLKDIPESGSLPEDFLFAGVDGGGTRCRAVIYDQQGKRLGKSISGPANVANDFELAKESIMESIAYAIRDAQLSSRDLSRLVVGAALAGLHLPSAQKKLDEWDHPFCKMYSTTDIHAAVLGAHQGKNGGVIVFGTGFSALGLVDGQQHSIGGFGFPTNAIGSGAWFGLEAVKAVLLDADKIGPSTRMTDELLSDISLSAFAERMHTTTPNQFAELAPLVFKHAKEGDAIAMDLIKEGAAFAGRVIDRLIDLGAGKVSLVGGVAMQITPWLEAAHQRHLVEAHSSPEWGAVLFAQQQTAD